MRRFVRFAPVLCVLAFAAVFLGWVFLKAGMDPLEFAFLGTRFSVPDPAGTEGYDGQFNYYIALDPDPQHAAPHLDVPAYRYQHILYPLLARALAFGNPNALPWTLLAINLACLAALTFLTGELIAERGGSRWGGLAVGLWFGVIAAVRLDLAEPLALLLVILAIWIAGPGLERRIVPVTLLLALSMLAKETMVSFLAGWIAWLMYRRRFSMAAFLSLAFIPFLVLQIWLWTVFGSPGLGSGGTGATPFEWIPYAGLLRIGGVSLSFLASFFIIYLPGLLLPAVIGLIAPGADLIRRLVHPEGMLLLANALMIAFAPFSTFREPLGIMRLGCGLILCMWLYAAAKKISWWNKLGFVSLAYLLFLS